MTAAQQKKLLDGARVVVHHLRAFSSLPVLATRGQALYAFGVDEKPEAKGGMTVAEIELADGRNVQGVALCSIHDNYDKAVGRGIAIERALESAVRASKGVQLKRAWVKFARKTYDIKPTRLCHSYDSESASYTASLKSGFVHLVNGGCRLFHVGPDVMVATDGSGGYMPFSISTLRELLDEVEALPVVSEFRCDK